ncbi:MAG TPA: ferredoxin [Methanophagales archaeon]|nr:ferredoxin [Methanophagales archaeon]
MIQINEAKCVGCGYCEVNCPCFAIIVFGSAKLNIGKCEECMKCLTVCPTNSIRMT